MQRGESLRQRLFCCSPGSKVQQLISSVSHGAGEGADAGVQEPEIGAGQELREPGLCPDGQTHLQTGTNRYRESGGKLYTEQEILPASPETPQVVTKLIQLAVNLPSHCLPTSHKAGGMWYMHLTLPCVHRSLHLGQAHTQQLPH